MVQTRTRVLASKTAAALDLPPLFRLVTLREAGNAFTHAKSIAAKEGAGTPVWVRRFDVVEFALVIEPDEPLRAARRAIYAGLAALADALAEHAPPERSITFDWPATIFVEGAVVGGGELAAAVPSAQRCGLRRQRQAETVLGVDHVRELAGKTLTFDVEILDVRKATQDELAHGHVHGPGGAHGHHG